jgi:hypothetical protein
MGLKAVLGSKTEVEALAEPLRALYVEKDGKFILDADVEEHPAVGGLRTALQKERDGRAGTDKELAKLRKDIDGLDPVKAREALAKLQELEDGKLIAEGKFEELVNQRTARLQQDHQAQLAEFQKQSKGFESQIGKLNEELATERIDNALTLIATKKGVRPTALTDVILRARRVWHLEDGKPVPKDGDKVIYGKDPSRPMPMDEWLDGLRTGDGAHLFEGSGGGGSSNTPTRDGKNVVLTRAQGKDTQVYRAAREQAAKQGGIVIIDGE